MKPIDTFLFFVVILLIMFGFQNRMYFNTNWLAKTIEIPSVEPCLPDTSSLIHANSVDTLPALAAEQVDTFLLFSTDWIDTINSVSTEPITSYSSSEKHGLPTSVFDLFFDKLKHAGDTLVRVIYYGDSQIEGDRITHTLRSALQDRFGGRGIGYMPAETYFNITEHFVVMTSDFEKQIVAYNSKGEKSDFGLYGRCFIPNKEKGVVRITNRSKQQSFNHLKILYAGSATMEIESSGGIVETYELENISSGMLEIPFATVPDNFRLTFSGFNDFKLYGFLLDPNVGVTVDHVPFRGNLNLMLNHFEAESFTETGKMLDPALVIMHFGLNIIPDIRTNYNSYRIAIENDIKLMKLYLPGACILVIGASDMAKRVKGAMASYNNIDAIVEAQRIAAANQQVAFWDLRAVMGGEGSIIEWVDKGWARTDYAHFTKEGTEMVGHWLTDFILDQHDQYMSSND